MIVIIASTGKADEVEKTQYACGICGFALNDLRECQRCRMQVEETAKGLSRRKKREDLFREIDEIVDERWEEQVQGEICWTHCLTL